MMCKFIFVLPYPVYLILTVVAASGIYGAQCECSVTLVREKSSFDFSTFSAFCRRFALRTSDKLGFALSRMNHLRHFLQPALHYENSSSGGAPIVQLASDRGCGEH